MVLRFYLRSWSQLHSILRQKKYTILVIEKERVYMLPPLGQPQINPVTLGRQGLPPHRRRRAEQRPPRDRRVRGGRVHRGVRGHLRLPERPAALPGGPPVQGAVRAIGALFGNRAR